MVARPTPRHRSSSEAGLADVRRGLGDARRALAVAAAGRKGRLIAACVAAAALAGTGTLLVTSTGESGTVGAAYSMTNEWSGGYTGEYVIANKSDSEVEGWTLEFDLPSGTALGKLWNGSVSKDGRHLTVTPGDHNEHIPAGGAVTVRFVAEAEAADGGAAGNPVNCLINDAKCSVDDASAPELSGRRTDRPSQKPSATPSRPPSKEPEKDGSGKNRRPAPWAGFAPYVDTSLSPSYDMTAIAGATGVKHFNLAFVHGNGCTPEWGGGSGLSSDPVAAQLGKLRAAGGDVRVSFGGASGAELATSCSSVSELTAAYSKVVDGYDLTQIDFDVESDALTNAAASTRRARAIAELQDSHPRLDVSFTLPAMPSGLTEEGLDLLADAKDNGVDISAVNIMAMDYGTYYAGDMGGYAIEAATATQGQVRRVLGLSGAEAWRRVAVTPMIGVNDVVVEKFTLQDAEELVDFAESRNLAWLSMWSGNRDRPCPGGTKGQADPTCSSIEQSANAFTKAFAAYPGGR